MSVPKQGMMSEKKRNSFRNTGKNLNAPSASSFKSKLPVPALSKNQSEPTEEKEQPRVPQKV